MKERSSGRNIRLFFQFGHHKINKQEGSKYKRAGSGQYRRIENDGYAYKNIRGYKYQGHQGIQFHFIDACTIKMAGSFTQPEDSGCRTGHAYGVQEDSEPKYLLKSACKNEY